MRSGEASVTAQRVAAHRLRFDRVAADYGDPLADERLARDIAGATPRSSTAIRAQLAARTRFFDHVVVGALDGEFRQVVVAAAGYDGRALRYAKPGVHWFEVDHPDTQADKRRRLARLGIDTAHIAFIPADFAVDPITKALATRGHDRTLPTLFLLEGVVVYLDREVVDNVLRQLRDAAAAGSRLAVSVSVDTGDGGRRFRRAALRAAVAALGEPMRTVIAPDEIDDFFGAAGWHVVTADTDRAHAAGLFVAEPVGRSIS